MNYIFTLLIVLFFTSEPVKGGWFDHHSEREHQADQQHIKELQTQVHQQQEQISHLHHTTFALGISCVVILVIGTAIGSKARKEVEHEIPR